MELNGIKAMARGMGANDVAVIFPEGTRSNPAKRERLLSKMENRDGDRASRLRALRHLLPPKVAGVSALFDAVPEGNVVVVWHVGFEGMDTFSGIIRQLSERPVHVHIAIEPHMRDTLTGQPIGAWLDSVWLDIDAKVHDLLVRS
jgi:1-acyl-sn-glycerol-3-phosphate acyltransferase